MSLATPARPDLSPGSPFGTEAPARPSAILGLAAALVWVGAVGQAYQGIGWYPPRTALPLLLAGAPVALGLGLLVARSGQAGTRSLLSVGLIVGSMLAPSLMVNHLPGVMQPEQIALPGRPTIALTAAPEGNFEVWLMRGDAQHVTRLTSTDAAEIGAALAPDGTSVVYSSDGSGTLDLYVMTLGPNGSPGEVRRLTSTEDADESAPAWSPDGAAIAYTAAQGDRSDVWVIGADGSGGRRVTSQGSASAPSCSPGGTHLAYAADAVGDPFDQDIWVTRADGSRPHDVIDVADDEWAPYWSPDGGLLLFSADATGDHDAWTCTLPCGDPTNLTAGSRDTDRAMGWTPDGHALVASDRLHTGGSFVYFVDDGGAVRLSLII